MSRKFAGSSGDWRSDYAFSSTMSKTPVSKDWPLTVRFAVSIAFSARYMGSFFFGSSLNECGFVAGDEHAALMAEAGELTAIFARSCRTAKSNDAAEARRKKPPPGTTR